MPRTVAIRKENAIRRYLRETSTEIKRVVWPSREEATKLTGIVIAMTVGMAVFLGIIDFLLSKGVNGLVSLLRGGI